MDSVLRYLLAQTVESGECWEWIGQTNKDGYGVFLGVLVHRWVFTLVWGDPGPLNVCHACDNPRCIRPDHLWKGTQADNMLDMRRKGRGHGQRPLPRPNVYGPW